MTEFSPGPWVWVGETEIRDKGEAGGSLVSATLMEQCAARDDWSRAPEIIQTDSGVYGPYGADRNLIAAAPRLYGALENLLLAASVDAVALRHQEELDEAAMALTEAREGRRQ